MITVNEIEKSVIVTDSTGDIVVVDDNTFQLTNGNIEIYNLPSVYDVVVYRVAEENHIERPEPESPTPEELSEELIPEEEIIPDEVPV